MRMDSPSMAEHRDMLIKHLVKEGFNVGKTQRGFVAVDEDGIVFNVSPGRAQVCRVHPITGQVMENRHKGMPDTHWFDWMISECVIWASKPIIRKPWNNADD